MNRPLVPVGEIGPWDHLVRAAHDPYVIGDDERCTRAVREGLHLAGLAGDRLSVLYLHYVQCLAHANVGQWARLAPEAAALRARLPAELGPHWRAKVLGVQAEAAVQLGDTSGAIDLLAEGYGVVTDFPGHSLNRASACHALTSAMTTMLLLKPASELLCLAGELFGRHPGASLALLDCARVEMLRGMLHDVLGNRQDAAEHYAVAASSAVRALSVVHDVGDRFGSALHARALLQSAFALLDLDAVDVDLLEHHLAVTLLRRDSLITAMALSRLAIGNGQADRAEAVLRQARRDADAAGEWGLALVATAWAAQVRAHERSAAGGPGGEPVATARHLALRQVAWVLDDRVSRFEAIVEQTRFTALARTVEEEDQLRWCDPLTEVGNRRLLDALLAGPDAERRPLVFVDVDHFKQINDVHGYQVGDAVLRGVAGILNRAARPHRDVVTRYGGDEFVVVLDQDGDPVDYADRVLAQVHAHDWAALSPGLTASVSLGVSGAGPGALKRADDRLRQAKARR